ncbi:MAG: helix-turn-helix transcriptional regulator [Lachnospiraceae bacterium]|nr:helix-turn-helix transcriptional regulator [Lachnospiraceae bacterium]
MQIGENIKNLRIEKGMTQKQLGEKCGIADSAIRRYELGGANPKRETLKKIADALGVSIYELTGEFQDIPHIGEQIRKYRTEAGLFLTQLAHHLKVTDQTLYKWEQGIIQPKAEQLLKICKILNISINDLYGVHLNSDMKLTQEEKQYLEKYRFISQYSPDGIDAVNYIMDREYKIARQIRDNEIHKEEITDITPFD